MPEPRLIKKYANRRLYDTVASKHVKLEDIRQLIVDGHDVKIVDDTNGDDLTRSLLLQIIADQEQGGRPMLDARLLTRIIRLYGNPMQGAMGEYLLKSFDAFMSQNARIQEQMRAALEATPLANMGDFFASNLKAWEEMQNNFLRRKRDGDNDPE